MKWIIDGSMYDVDSNVRLMDSLRKNNIDFQEVKYRLFMSHNDIDDLIQIDTSCSYLSYGSINFITKLQKLPEIKPGSFCNFKGLECTSYYPKLKGLLVNNNHIITTWIDFITNSTDYFKELGIDDCLFLRPNSGRKVFTGGVFSFDEYEDELETTFRSVSSDTIIVIAPPKNIDVEWRFFVCFDKVITGSQFHKKGRLCISETYDKMAHDLAEYASTLYTPDPIFVIDIGKLSTGEYRIVELNSFSCSGLYACDTDTLVKEASLIVDNMT